MADASFDIFSKIDVPELKNSITQSLREIGNRFDLKDADASIDHDEKSNTLSLRAKEEYQLQAVIDILKSNLIKRKIAPRAFQFGEFDHALGGNVKCNADIQQGIPQDKAKAITKDIKDAKLKVKTQIQGDQLRVTGKKKDDLQAVIALLRDKDYGIHMAFGNYR